MYRLLSAHKILIALFTLVCSLWHTASTITSHRILPDPQPYSRTIHNLSEVDRGALDALNGWLDLESDGVAYAATVDTPSKFRFAARESDIQYAHQVQQVKVAAVKRNKQREVRRKANAAAATRAVAATMEIASAANATEILPQRQRMHLNIDALNKHKEQPRVEHDSQFADRLPAYLDGGRLEEARAFRDLDDDARIVRERKFRIRMGDDIGLLVESRINDDREQGKNVGVGLGLHIKF